MREILVSSGGKELLSNQGPFHQQACISQKPPEGFHGMVSVARISNVVMVRFPTEPRMTILLYLFSILSRLRLICSPT